MLVSILHRATGVALTIGGLALLTWWLVALASGGSAYDDFSAISGSWLGLVVLVGLTWSFFQHGLSGIRHLMMDSGAGFELKGNKTAAILTIIGSLILTAALWIVILGRTA